MSKMQHLQKGTKVKRSPGERIIQVIIYLVLIAVCLLIVLPCLNVVALAFNDGKDAARGGVYFWPRMFTLENFQEGSFHVMEPVGGKLAAEQNALVFVPGLGFDARGNRIGYGGGYYDRYLARHPQYMKIGTAYAIQLVEELEAEAHDISMDGIATEEGFLWMA